MAATTRAGFGVCDRVGTRSAAADMSARFERDVERGALGVLASLLQCNGFGMGTSPWRRSTSAENVAASVRNHGAHGWIRPGLAEAAPRQHQRLRHMMEIRRAHACVRALRSVLN